MVNAPVVLSADTTVDPTTRWQPSRPHIPPRLHREHWRRATHPRLQHIRDLMSMQIRRVGGTQSVVQTWQITAGSARYRPRGPKATVEVTATSETSNYPADWATRRSRRLGMRCDYFVERHHRQLRLKRRPSGTNVSGEPRRIPVQRMVTSARTATCTSEGGVNSYQGRLLPLRRVSELQRRRRRGGTRSLRAGVRRSKSHGAPLEGHDGMVQCRRCTHHRAPAATINQRIDGKSHQ